jgi:hypothetical protein
MVALQVLAAVLLLVGSGIVLDVARKADARIDQEQRVLPSGRSLFDHDLVAPETRPEWSTVVLVGALCLTVGMMLAQWMNEGALESHEENGRVMSGLVLQSAELCHFTAELTKSPWEQIKAKRARR